MKIQTGWRSPRWLRDWAVPIPPASWFARFWLSRWHSEPRIAPDFDLPEPVDWVQGIGSRIHGSWFFLDEPSPRPQVRVARPQRYRFQDFVTVDLLQFLPWTESWPRAEVPQVSRTVPDPIGRSPEFRPRSGIGFGVKAGWSVEMHLRSVELD